MQLLGINSDAIINNDWHLCGTKHLSIFCGVWTVGQQEPQFKLGITFEEPHDHQAIEFDLCIWRFQLEVRVYDGRHWYANKNRFYLDDEETEETRKEDGWQVSKD